jgi:hypothetical protein
MPRGFVASGHHGGSIAQNTGLELMPGKVRDVDFSDKCPSHQGFRSFSPSFAADSCHYNDRRSTTLTRGIGRMPQIDESSRAVDD